jgi:sulfatase modifying factor 1
MRTPRQERNARALTVAAALAAVTVLVVACADVLGIDDRYVAGDGSVPSDGPADAAAEGAPVDAASDTAMTAVDSGCPVEMIRAGSFCIDATEVTQAAYAAFLIAKKGDTSGQSATCVANTDWKPSCTGTTVFNDQSRVPVGCVDWCDAQGYCAWAGKRLCGKIGGGPIAQDAGTTSADAWFAACSNFGTRTYPYGDTFDGSACNSYQPGGMPVEVERFLGCMGGVPGLYDMAGNVWEWEDSCTAVDAGVRCSRRGGGAVGLLGAAYETQCGSNYQLTPFETRQNDIGFRCCAEP